MNIYIYIYIYSIYFLLNIGKFQPATLPEGNGYQIINPKVVDIAVGSFHSCAVLDNGGMKCWGYGRNGQLGQGDLDIDLSHTKPAKLLLKMKDWVVATQILCIFTPKIGEMI